MKIRILISILVAVACSSCTANLIEPETEERTKVFSLSDGAETKVFSTPGDNFSWNVNDTVKYYNLKSSGAVSATSTQTTYAKQGGTSSDLEVSYTYPTDKNVVTVFLGTALASKTVSGLAKNNFTVAGSIPSSPDGTMLPYLVCTAKGNLETDRTLTLKHLQTFISFSLNTQGTNTGNYDKIVISDKAGTKNIAGDATYTFDDSGNITGCAIASSGSKSITLVAKAVGTVYYVPVCPQNFSSGLRVTLYKGSTRLAYADTKSGDFLDRGKINDLGVLDFHKVIPSVAVPVITPEYSAICNKGGFYMTKKLWVKVDPLDVTGLTWEIIKAGTSLAAGSSAVTDATTIRNDYGIITPGDGTETYDGKTQYTATVTPKCASGWLLVRVKVDCDDGTKTKGYALIVVGDFIDIGSNTTLWARSNLKGSVSGSNKASLCDKTSDLGSYYQWGALVEFDGLGKNEAARQTMYKTMFPNPAGTGVPSWSGKYNSVNDPVKILRPEDDICTQSNSAWHIPSWTEVQELTPDSRDNVSVKPVGGDACVCYSSRKIGFTDVFVPFPLNGSDGTFNNGPYHVYSEMHYALNEVYTGTTGYDPGTPRSPSSLKSAWYSPRTLAYCPTAFYSSQHRHMGWGIRPVRTKSGYYPSIGTAPFKD